MYFLLQRAITLFILLNLFIPNALAGKPLEWYREESRQIMRKRLCGVCHIPPGNSHALKIFNLDQMNWSSTMSNKQLAQIKWRINAKGNEIKEMKGDPKKHEFTKEEKKILNDFVEKETLNRVVLSHTTTF